ncbi:MAG: Inner membrane transport permease YadH [Legionellaceae bacterium]
MATYSNYIAFKTLLKKEILRFLKIWIQTLLPPAITMLLYFVIFGTLVGKQLGKIQGFTYMQYIAPGLIMMAVVTNAYANVVGSFFSARFQKNIEEMLISPMPNWLILTGFISGGVIRGLTVGFIVAIISLFFTKLTVYSFLLTIMIIFLTAILLSLAGFLNGLYAKKFDDISIIPTFILTPLTYLGGIFYSVKDLSPFWQQVSLFNPILYMVNAFRYGILGISDIHLTLALMVIVSTIIILFYVNLHLLNKGTGIRT